MNFLWTEYYLVPLVLLFLHRKDGVNVVFQQLVRQLAQTGMVLRSKEKKNHFVSGVDRTRTRKSAATSVGFSPSWCSQYRRCFPGDTGRRAERQFLPVGCPGRGERAGRSSGATDAWPLDANPQLSEKKRT